MKNKVLPDSECNDCESLGRIEQTLKYSKGFSILTIPSAWEHLQANLLKLDGKFSQVEQILALFAASSFI